MNCEDFLSLLPSYPDSIPAGKALEMRAHALYCPECQRHLTEQEGLLSSLRTLDDGLPVPESFTEGWRRMVESENKPGRKPFSGRVASYAAVAAAVLMLTFGTMLMRSGVLFPSSGTPGETGGLASEQGYSGPFAAYDADGFTPPALVPMAKMSDDTAESATDEGGQAAQEPVILHTASVSINTERYDQDMGQIDLLLKASGGWSEYRSEYGEPVEKNPSAGRYATMTLRVPMDSLESFVEAVSKIGRVTGSEMTAEDISDRYYDTKARLEMYEAQRERLTELMARAEDMADIIEIDSRLSEVQFTIESLMGTLNSWNSRANSAVVHVSVAEVAQGGTKVVKTLAQRLGAAISDSFKAAGAFAADLLVFLVMAAPYILVLAVIGALVVFVIRRKKKRVNLEKYKGRDYE